MNPGRRYAEDIDSKRLTGIRFRIGRADQGILDFSKVERRVALAGNGGYMSPHRELLCSILVRVNIIS